MFAVTSNLNMGDGALVFVLGILFVIFVLILLVLIVKATGILLKKIFELTDSVKAKRSARRDEKNKNANDKPNIDDTSANDNEEEVVAAVFAALLAYYEADKKETITAKPPFIIKNIKRIK